MLGTEALALGCWQFGRSRASCCYGGRRRHCDWGNGALMERCCAPAAIRTGPKAVAYYLGDESFEIPLQDLVTQTPALLASVLDTTLYLGGLADRARGHIDHLHEQNKYEDTNFAMHLNPFFFYLLLYHTAWIATQAGSRLSSAAKRKFLSAELDTWKVYADVYRFLFGRVDLCRCIHPQQWHMVVGAHLRSLMSKGSASVDQLLNSSSEEHDFVQKHPSLRCDTWSREDLQDNIANGAMTASCIPGDIAEMLFLLQSCALNQDVAKTLLIYSSLLPLALLGRDCHSVDYWNFDLYDIVAMYGEVVWELAQPSKEPLLVGRTLLRGMSNFASGSSQNDVRTSSMSQCGPHVSIGPLQVAVPHRHGSAIQAPGTSPALRQLCTDLGRFWIDLDLEPVAPDSAPGLSLVVIPITFAWWANPWHHWHWWIPALWQLRVRLLLDPEQTQLGFVFVKENWSMPVSTLTQGGSEWDLRRTDAEWSFLQPEWPSQLGDNLNRYFGPGTLHADVITMLSRRPAMALQDLHGSMYQQVIVGLPNARWTLQTPHMSCLQVREVRSFVLGSWQYHARGRAAKLVANARDDLVSQTMSSKPALRILQRMNDEGRWIVNFDDLLEHLRVQLGAHLHISAVDAAVLKNAPWIDQFRIFSMANIIMGAHGAGLTWLWSLPHGSAAIELSPFETPSWVPCLQRWNDHAHIGATFAGLASLTGVHYTCSKAREPASGVPETSTLKGPEWMKYNVVADLEVVEGLLWEAMRLVGGPLPPCSG